MTFSHRFLFCFTAVCLLAPLVRAGSDDKNLPTPKNNDASEVSHFNLTEDFDLSESYVGSADVRRESRSSSLDEYNSEARFVLSTLTRAGYLRFGVEWDRYSFGLSDNSPLPNTLQNVNLVVGLDGKLSDSILFRIEAQPGLYGTFFDHLTTGDFNVPFVIGGTYLYSPDLQIVAGVGVDINRKYPVLPALGVRWKAAPKLVFNAVLPAPRVEYELNKSTTLYAGAELKGNNYRVGRHFGDDHHDPRLNRAVVTFSEVRAGVGLTQKLSNSLTLSAEGGIQPFREFDFYRADAHYRSDGVAPYGQVAVHGAF